MGPSSTSASEVPGENVLESLNKIEIRGSVQLQTVLAIYEQEIDRDRAMPSYQRLNTMVRRHIVQMIRTRNFRARNERIETRMLVKSHKGKNASVERRMGECHQWKANGQRSRGDSCSFRHGSDRGQQAQSSSPAPKAQTQIDGRKHSKGIGPRGESPSGRKGQKACKNKLKDDVRTSNPFIFVHIAILRQQIAAMSFAQMESYA